MAEALSGAAAPLLEAADGRWKHKRGEGGSDGGATAAQTLGNIIVSIVGTGVLGLPYAFRVAGWFAGTLGISAAGLLTFYCMLLLIQCRKRLQEEEDGTACYQTYGDLGGRAFGEVGRYLTELLIVVAQTGGSIAYLVFIGQNLSSIFNLSSGSDQQDPYVSPAIFIFLIMLPLQVALSFIRSLSTLAPFSAFADVCNVLAIAIVIKEDLLLFDGSFQERSAFNGAWGLPFAGGVAVFCFEGFTLTLALEASMVEKRKYPWVLAQAFLGITVAYVCFGVFGYLAYGDETKDIITLNLPHNWTSTSVKIGLCVALAFTFPMMMHPINEIMENRLTSSGWLQKLICRMRGAVWMAVHLSRVLVLLVLCSLASFVPGFGSFISFVGSTVCALLSFVFPATFHLIFVGPTMGLGQRLLDYAIVFVGLVFAGFGTYDAIAGRSAASAP